MNNQNKNNPYLYYTPNGADLLFNVVGMSIIDVEHQDKYVKITVETTKVEDICPKCQRPAKPVGRRDRVVIDIPCFGKASRVKVRQRQFRCLSETCKVKMFTQKHKYLLPKCKLSTRAIKWATVQLGDNNMSVRGLQREMFTGWSTIWNPVSKYLKSLANNTDRLKGVKIIGVDEHVWHHSYNEKKGSKYLTGIFDLTKDEHGNVRSRLIDLISDRTTKVYEDWLKKQPQEFRDGVRIATLDPYRGYRKALENTFDDITVAVDPFHIVKLASTMMDEVRRRLQNEQTGHRGRKGDPLYSIRNILLASPDKLSQKQQAKMDNVFAHNDPTGELKEAYESYQMVRSVYNRDENAGKCYAIALRVMDELVKSSTKEVKRLGSTLNKWRDQFLNFFKAGRVSNGGAQALNGIIELHRRVARGFTNPTNYRLRMLAACGKLW